MKNIDFKFNEHDAAIYNNQIVRVEERAIVTNGTKIYLVCCDNSEHKYVYENELKEYIG